MVDESSKERKKVPISEEDAATILHRYSPEMILAVLQEVSQNVGEKIDWHALVKNTNTGITSAKEYQMLWRHLAYGQTLIDQIDDTESPLDDDSDLEVERESFPPVSREASAEAAACVKVLMASGCINDLDVPSNSTIETPLTINVPNIKALTAPLDSSLHAHAVQSMNITIPVFVQKQPLSSVMTGEKRPISEPSGVNFPPRRKRKGLSSTGEDMKLTAAVQKHGEQFANIASGDFKKDRKVSELSQRWTNLKKKQGNTNIGYSSQHSEMQVAATNRSISAALDMKSASHISIVGTKLSHQPQKISTMLGTAGPPKSQLPAERPSLIPTPGPDPMIKAAAIAAGARIATSADAASLMEAARSQHVVHIKTGGASGMQSPSTSIANQLPTNVHFIRDGLANAPISAHSASKLNVARPSEVQKTQGHPIRTGSIPVATNGPVKTADGPVKPLGQSDRGVDDADPSKGTPAEQKVQSSK